MPDGFGNVTESNQKPKTYSLRSLGTSGLRRTGNYVYEEFLPELRWPQAARIYQEMQDNDPVIGAILYLTEMLIRGASWKVEAASDSTEDVSKAEFVESCMNDMEMSWANTISEILSMLSYGFSFHEIVYKIRRGPQERSSKYRSKYSDGKIGWRRLPIRAQTSLEGWEFDREGNVVAFLQRCDPTWDLVKIPMNKGLLFRTRVSKNNPEGKSLLRNAYRPWYYKKHMEEIEGIGIERDLAGFPMLTAPEEIDLWNPDDPIMVKLRIEAEELVRNIRRDSEEGVVLPYGWDLKLLSSTTSRQINIGTTIERYDNRIAITLLSDIILLGNQSGSFALADIKQSILSEALQSQLLNIADVFNTRAIPMLLEVNNMDIGNCPKIVPGNIKEPSIKELALILRAMGLDISKDQNLINHIRGLLNFPGIDSEEFKQVYENAVEDEASLDPLASVQDSSDKLLQQNDLQYGGESYNG